MPPESGKKTSGSIALSGVNKNRRSGKREGCFAVVRLSELMRHKNFSEENFFMTQLYMKQEVNSKRQFFGNFLVAIGKLIAYHRPSFLPENLTSLQLSNRLMERIDGAKEDPVEAVS